MVGAHACLMFTWSALRHRHFGSSARDLGAYESVFWNLAHRGVPWNSVERFHQWSAHPEVGLAWLAIPFRYLPSPHWLFALQAVACALAAVPVERIARERLGDARLALVCAGAMLLTPQLLMAEILDFHSITVCALPIALVAYGVDRDRPWWLLAGALAAMSLREQMGLAVAGGALAWAALHGRKRWLPGAAVAVAGAGVFLVQVLWWIPSFAGGAPFRYLYQYQRVGGSPGAALRMALGSPLRFTVLALEGGRALYPLKLAAGALPALAAAQVASARAAWPLLVGAPLLAIQLLADRFEIWSIRFQYGAPLVPLVSVAGVLGIAAAGKRWPGRAARALALLWLVGNAAFSARLLGIYATLRGGPLEPGFEGSARQAALARAVALVPDAASVCAQDNVVPHLADRAAISAWPDCPEEDEYVVLDGGGAREGAEQLAVAGGLARLRGDPRFTVVMDEQDVLVLRRRPKEGR